MRLLQKTRFRFSARPAGFSAGICRYTFEYPATWKLDTVNKVGSHRGACAVHMPSLSCSPPHSSLQCERAPTLCALGAAAREGHAGHRFQGLQHQNWQE